MSLLEADALTALLNAAERNHALISNNLANVNTPGYRTQRLAFARQLDDLLDVRGRLLPGSRIETRAERPMYRDVSADGNDVSLEREIVELNVNTLRMQLYLEVLGNRIRKLRMAIEGK